MKTNFTLIVFLMLVISGCDKPLEPLKPLEPRLHQLLIVRPQAINKYPQLTIAFGDTFKVINKHPESFDADFMNLRTKEILQIKYLDTGIDEMYSPAEDYFWSLDLATALRNRYGKALWQMVKRGEVKIGWTEEICYLSLGAPYLMSESINDLKQTEKRWYYHGRDLYFINQKLVKIQNKAKN